MTINFRGYVFDDSGAAVSGASVKLLDTGTTTQEGSTATTDSNGLWYFDTVSEADGPFDVEITKGSSVRRIRWNDQIHLKEIDIRNNTGATTPALTAVNFTNNASNQVAVFRSDRGVDGSGDSRAADGDAVYVSFNLRNDNNEEHEFARMTATAVDVSNGNEDGRFSFSVATGTDGGLDEIFVIDSSTGSAATISYEVDSFTIKGGEGEAGVLYLFADQGDDAGDEWKINVADGGVLTIGNDINSAGVYVTHMTLTPNSTVASSTVAFAGSVTVAGDLTISGDDLVMGTNTDGFVLVADGTNYNPVAVSGDIAITNAGVTSIASGVIVNADVNSSAAIAQSKLSLTDASTSAKGIAQFSSDNFAASSGTITIKDGGVVTAELADDAVTSAKIADDAITSALIADDAVVTAAIADDAITSALIADDAVVTAAIADTAVTFANIQNVAANSILGRNANSSGVLSEVALATTQILIGDGTGFTAAALSGDATMTNAGVVSLAAAQTNVNSLLAANIVIGEDAQTQIDFETANEIHFDADNAEIAKITATGLTMSAGENIYLGDGSSVNIATPLLAGGDHTYSGVTAQMLAGGAISAFNLVCIHTTTQEVVVADASAGATARAIGIAPAAISDTATGTILLHGFVRDDTWNWTTGAVLFLSETAGALTETAPTTDGAFVQAVGIALEPDVVFINPSLDIIEHA